jgi:hypothetical protein
MNAASPPEPVIPGGVVAIEAEIKAHKDKMDEYH